VLRGARFISKTAHPRFGLYRERSPLWQPTSTNLVPSTQLANYPGARAPTAEFRPHTAFSHEYIGGAAEQRAAEEALARIREAVGPAAAEAVPSPAHAPGANARGKRPASGAASIPSAKKAAKGASPQPAEGAAQPKSMTMLSFFNKAQGPAPAPMPPPALPRSPPPTPRTEAGAAASQHARSTTKRARPTEKGKQRSSTGAAGRGCGTPKLGHTLARGR